MITLITLCDLFWLLWLLPLLLGALLMWLYWRNKYASMVSEYDGKVKGLNGRISRLEGDLVDCANRRAELEGDLAITKGRMREVESEMKTLKAGLSAKGNAESAKDKSTLGAASNIAPKTGTGSADLRSVASSIASGSATSGSTGGGAKKSIYSKITANNLQIIEGIGPKMEGVLKENGINTHADLASKDHNELNAILAKYGDRYKIIDPTTWAQQARYAADNDYDGLIDLQKKLDTGKDTASNLTDSKLEKYLIKIGAMKAFKQDDLKAIEGIGPATEKLLHENGIKTWRDLANTDASTIKDYLTAAGSRFALGDPTTWPKQAEMAADGKFEELREYQDFLDGGKG